MKKLLLIYCLLIALLLGCTRNEFIVIDKRYENMHVNDDTSIIKNEYLVNFTSQVYNSFVSTGNILSEVAPFAKGNKAQIFVCVYDGPFLIWPYYQALTAGTLTPVEDPVIVVDGLYDFYFTSVNSPDDPPIMRNSIVSPVANGLDYLWYFKHLNIQVNNSNVPILFTHSTAQIVINVVNEGSSEVVDWINFTMIQVPDTIGMEWGLYDGVISKLDSTTNTRIPAQSLLPDQQVMNSSGLISTLCVLPLQYEGSLDAYLSMKMHDVTSSDSITGFDISLEIPNDELVAGNSYHYTVNFTKDTVYVDDVEIESWIVVDLEGTPLYPSIKEED